MSEVFSPADIDIRGHLPGGRDGVVDGGGDGEGQEEVREGQTEDEDIPCCPHLCSENSGEHHQQVSQN